MIDYECPRCGEQMHSPESLRGGTEFCPNCRKAVEVPDESLGNEDLLGDLEDEDFDDCDFDDDESLAEEENDSGGEIVSMPLPANTNPSPIVRRSSLGVLLSGIASGIAAMLALLLYWLGGFAFHVWTAYLYYVHWGTFWAIVALFFPFLAEAIAVSRCFGWGVWFYILAVATWLTGFMSAAVLSEARGWKLAGACSVLMVLLIGSFGYFAVDYAMSPQPMTADFRNELDDAATGVCSVLNASSVAAFNAEEVKTSAELIGTKAALRKRLRRYDNTALAHIRQSVDSYLSFMCLVQADMKTYMRTRDQDGQAIFAFSEATRKGIDKLPSGVKSALGRLQIREAEKELSQQLAVPDNGDPLPAGWEGRVQALFDRQWRTYAEVYQDLLGTPMPSPEQLGMNSRSPGS